MIGHNRAKIAIFNENIRTVAHRHDAVIADLWALQELADPRMWDPDRLHFSPLGYHTIAKMVLDTLNVPHTLQPNLPKDLPESSWRHARAEDLVWARNYLVPWVLKRIRHQTEEELRAKRPVAGPVFGLELPVGTAGLESQASELVPEPAGKLAQQVRGVDAEVGQQSCVLVGVDLVGKFRQRRGAGQGSEFPSVNFRHNAEFLTKRKRYLSNAPSCWGACGRRGRGRSDERRRPLYPQRFRHASGSAPLEPVRSHGRFVYRRCG